MVSKIGYSLLINGIYWGYNPLILTIDPNFLGHPSTNYHEPPSNRIYNTTPGQEKSADDFFNELNGIFAEKVV